MRFWDIFLIIVAILLCIFFSSKLPKPIADWHEFMTASNCNAHLHGYCIKKYGEGINSGLCYLNSIGECESLQRAATKSYLEGLPVAVRDVYRQWGS